MYASEPFLKRNFCLPTKSASGIHVEETLKVFYKQKHEILNNLDDLYTPFPKKKKKTKKIKIKGESPEQHNSAIREAYLPRLDLYKVPLSGASSPTPTTSTRKLTKLPIIFPKLSEINTLRQTDLDSIMTPRKEKGNKEEEKIRHRHYKRRSQAEISLTTGSPYLSLSQR